MYVVFLRFSAGREQAGRLMQAHKDWLERGFDEGVFLLAGSIQPQAGGMILASGVTLAQLEERVKSDPFVAEDVVQAEIVAATPSRADPRLAFLLADVGS
ncbi:YciI family protein [Pseudomonas sp. R1-7]|uniref:YciI family protein n=1 Tax=Pseudomonas sp. R1-7 TaxID=2817398 RepID=UPI003DA8443A